MKCIIIIVNLLGLAFDIYGAYGLFSIKQVVFKSPNFSAHNHERLTGDKSPKSMLNKLSSMSRQANYTANTKTDENEKSAYRFFRFIFIGFIFQFIATFLGFFL